MTNVGAAAGHVVRRDQAWFWTEEWQAKEAEADAQIARGDGIVYASDEEFLASFNAGA